ncbi:sensor histidine kinase [Paenibacillus thermotolerans]|uniref:sensor histidine kinase n=1 Tax=Paenibacillus thermotolerans TaxID=3027807 RepID=UPI00236776B7|nr:MULTISPECIES: HAMP domain-containing sensor histidine kinase [unclassified Paenibacillus]
MKDNFLRRLIFRLVGQIIASLLLTVPAVFVTAAVAAQLENQLPIIGDIISAILRAFNSTFLIAAAAFFYFILFMVIFNIGRFRYTVRMIESVRRISQGQFNEKVPVQKGSELGDLAGYINTFVTQLNESLEDERRAEQTKNELITNVSHDLRTPLTSILGYLGLVEQDRYRDEVELRHYVGIAYDKAQRLNVLINDLFEYTRMRYDAVPLYGMKLNLVELLAQLLEQYRLPLAQNGMEGTLRHEENAIPIYGDPNKLVRVFENLVENAMVYGKEGRRIDIAAYRAGAEAVVEVANYGEPIPTVDLPHIFDRFYRVEKSRAEHTGGSGLGLAIVKSIVDRHGGTITVSSDSSRTCFYVRLPISAAQ